MLSDNMLNSTTLLARTVHGSGDTAVTPERRNTMRPAALPRCAISAIFAGCVLLLAVAPASAQSQNEQVEQFIERTAEIIDWAGEQVLETESQQARRILEEAKNLHGQSLEHLDRGRRTAAFTTSRRAREAAQHAARLAREVRNQEARVQLRLERFMEYRDQIAERARETDNERALRFVQEAEEQAMRAHDHYRQGNHDLAAHLVESAEDLLSRAGRLLFEGGATERLQQEIERSRDAIDGIAERLVGTGDEGAARDLLESARAAVERAEAMARRGQPLRAMRTLRLARRLAGQAAGASEGGLDHDSVSDQLERLDDRVELMSERVSEAPSDSARDALDRARHHRELAVELLAKDDLEASLRHIKAAFDLLNAARDLTR